MMRPTAIQGPSALAYYDSLVTPAAGEEPGVGGQGGGGDDGSGTSPRARAVEDYYLSTDEMPGRWWGEQAAALGLEGEASREQLRALLDGTHPATGERLGQKLRPDGVRGYDLTFSAPKSVSVLSALLGGEHEKGIVEAHDAAVAAVMRHFEEQATTRAGRNGVFKVDAQGVTALLVRHRTSRTRDPQLHTHALLFNRVRGPDGRWRALDAARVFREQRALGALYQAALRSELTRRLGVVWEQPVKGLAEVKDFPVELLEAFSTRTAQVKAELDARLARFRAEQAREPGPREFAILSRDAARESRPAKQRGRHADENRAEWLATGAERGWDALRLGDEVLDVAAAREPAVGRERRARVAELGREVIEALSMDKSAWTRAAVEREVATRLDADEGRTAAEQAREVELVAGEVLDGWCVDLAAAADEDAPRRASDGRPLGEEPGVERYTIGPLLEQEQRIVRWATEQAAAGGRPATDRELARADAAAALDPEQAHAAALVAGTQPLVVVVGPAGTGKTTAMRAGVQALQAQGRPVLGLAPSAVAAENLEREAGVRAHTLERFLLQASLDLEAPRGTTLIVDEAAMASTPDVDRLRRLAVERGYRVALVGDNRQLAAVGRGGMFDQARAVAPAARLQEVRRFEQAWEAEASLALRAGQPAALDAYLEHGCVRSGPPEAMRDALLADWAEAQAAGRRGAWSVATNDQARELNNAARTHRVAAGDVDDTHVLVTAGGERIGAGDLIATRRNDRRLETDHGAFVKNRQRWTVTHIGEDGSLTASGAAGTVTLPGDYAAEQVQLAYFSTAHGVQGLTEQVGGTLVDPAAGYRSLYVGLTRGRENNIAYVVVDDEQDPRDALAGALRRDRADLGVLAVRERLEREARDAAARQQDARTLVGVPTSELQRDLAGLRARIGSYPEHLAARREQTHAELDRTRGLAAAARARVDELEADTVGRLRRRPADPAALAFERARAADADAAAATLERDLARLEAQLPDRAAWEAERAPLRERARELAVELQTRADRHVRDALTHPPEHLTQTLGARPDAAGDARAWDEAAAAVERYRFDHAYDGPDAIGRPPRDPDALGAWRQARTALEHVEHARGQVREGPGLER